MNCGTIIATPHSLSDWLPFMRKAPPFSQDSEFDNEAGRPSKSALKRQMHDLQALGEELTRLPDSRIAPLNLPENLLDALAEFHRTRSFEGKRRQLQYVGKLMRHVDADPVREAVAAFKLGSALDTLRLHEAERWREELLTDDNALTRWMAEHPSTEAQALRSLVRAARKDRTAATPEQRHGRAYRDLFQLIKATLAQAAAAPDADDEEDAVDHEEEARHDHRRP